MKTSTHLPKSERLRTSDLPAQPLVFAMMPSLRRSAAYVIVGLILIVAVGWYLADSRPRRGVVELAFAAASVAVIVLGVFMVFRWRLRVDAAGISRRRLIGWDLWPWAAFAEGRVHIEDSVGLVYSYPEKPFWARRLALEILEEDDRRLVDEAVQRVWVPPPMPRELTIRFGWRKEALISESGLAVRTGREVTTYRWRDVTALRIQRRPRQRFDFARLDLELPGTTITLRVTIVQGRPNLSWMGGRGSVAPRPAVVASMFERYVPPTRTFVWAI
jgi:hypothetical protein